ncbi:hypothetical protein [Streptomyces sp. G-G2]|uniref:hypothetical protein n=1 Tax=Streptomyces sp. G-G2 TaxID=3046201 RepID=UPI0024BAEAD1|nr:hypothetical protein [Streptomyces sp. G-G2]MDJ0381230.1 hypothetical protein [Streptomyces sp. G-G2]
MTTSPTEAVRATARPVPRWAERVARAIPLLMLPVCLWRLPFAFGFSMGLDMTGSVQPPLWISVPYVFGLSCLSELAAFLCFGLVRGWGEVLPAAVPLLGGRPLRPAVVLVPASVVALGANLLLVDWVLTTFRIAGYSGPTMANGWWALLASVVSGLFALWGPLLTVLIGAYYVRRCRAALGRVSGRDQ